MKFPSADKIENCKILPRIGKYLEVVRKKLENFNILDI